MAEFEAIRSTFTYVNRIKTICMLGKNNQPPQMRAVNKQFLGPNQFSNKKWGIISTWRVSYVRNSTRI